MKYIYLICVIFSLLFLVQLGKANQTSNKLLIEVGWDAPTPNIIRANIKTMQQRPFDGLMLNLRAGKTIFNKTAYPDNAFNQDQTDLAATNFGKLKNNFVTIWSARETNWDWFNDQDWAATENNARNFAKTAKIGRCKGFFFDPEPYGTNPWSYTSSLYPNKSFSSVQAKVRQRGAAFMNAIQSQMPDVTILMFFAATIVKAQADAGGDLQKADWVLLAAFMDGMLDVINPQATLIDGNEGSYYYTKTQAFSDFRQFKNEAKAFVSPENRSKYDSQVKIAHAVFVDGLLNLLESPRFFGYYLQNTLERQQFLEHNIYHALQNADQYVWVYNENMDWWNTQGKGVQLPNGLESLVARAAKKVAQNKPLGFSVEAFVTRALARFDAKVQIAGRITENTNGIDGVYLDSGRPFKDRNADASCDYSNNGGYFTCTVPPNWTGTITPSKNGLIFEPPKFTFKNQSKDIYDLTFQARQK